MKAMKTICLFCGKSHKEKPDLCKAKGDVMRSYLNHGLELWQVMHGVESGMINLELEAKQLLENKKTRRKCG
jgi:hypothetical protein